MVSELSFASIGLVNPKSPENVGSVLRAAGCYGASSIFYTGERYYRASRYVTDTKKMHTRIPTLGVDDLRDVLPEGATPVAIELVRSAKPLPAFEHPKKAFYIFGPEDGSIDKRLVNWCQEVVYIPTQGCMNLAATVNVVLYDRLCKQAIANPYADFWSEEALLS
ncbi:RNA methyltransferase [Celerinatantimonas sp. MCCC 1A17872]|uniref:RNA methyltransferase n=1 Tax=Celerinatantimonas sp. MCCC 1A17872 TaxID=3177514 RepID=UPI0038C13171